MLNPLMKSKEAPIYGVFIMIGEEYEEENRRLSGNCCGSYNGCCSRLPIVFAARPTIPVKCSATAPATPPNAATK